MNKLQEIAHFMEKEIELSEERLLDDENPMYDGVNVGIRARNELLRNHAALCQRIMDFANGKRKHLW